MIVSMKPTGLFWSSPLLALMLVSASSRKYTSPDQSFEFTVPAGYDLYTDTDKPAVSYIPVCREDSVVCAVSARTQ